MMPKGLSFIVIALLLGLPRNSVAQENMPPLPPPRPGSLSPAQEDVDKPSSEAVQQQTSANDDENAACIERLGKLGLRFEKKDPVQDRTCGIGNPVSVSVLTNDVEVTPASLMECRYAESLARWISDVVVPRAREHFQSKPTKLLIGTSYQCRDQRSGSKMSEHAFGNGVDVMGFEFDKHPTVTIKSQADGSSEAAFQSSVQKEACTIFTTVLGPGADADHGDHLHLDMRERKGDYRICQ
jgi:hypothetical protein